MRHNNLALSASVPPFYWRPAKEVATRGLRGESGVDERGGKPAQRPFSAGPAFDSKIRVSLDD